MKQKLLFFALLFACSFAFSQTNSIVGTWKLVSEKMTHGDSVTNYGSSTLNSMKIISPTHFAVFTHNPDGSFAHALGGAASFTANTYTESIDYGSRQSMIGQKARFSYEVRENQLHMKGGVGGYTFDETWTRIK